MKPQQRLRIFLAGLPDAFARIWAFGIASLVLLAVVAAINPVLLGSYAWAMSKLSGAAVLAYALDKAAFRGNDPRYLEGIQQDLAQTRRATLMAAAMIAAGLIG